MLRHHRSIWAWLFHRHHHHKHHRPIVILFVDNVGIVLKPNEEIDAMFDVTVGHSIALSIQYLDAVGQPMLKTPTPDAPPTWSNTTPATETLVVAPDGLTAQTSTLVAGLDSISVSVVVGGATFNASLAVSVDAAPQVLTSVAITAVAS